MDDFFIGFDWLGTQAVPGLSASADIASLFMTSLIILIYCAAAIFYCLYGSGITFIIRRVSDINLSHE